MVLGVQEVVWRVVGDVAEGEGGGGVDTGSKRLRVPRAAVFICFYMQVFPAAESLYPAGGWRGAHQTWLWDAWENGFGYAMWRLDDSAREL